MNDDDNQQQQPAKVVEVKTLKTFAELLRFKKATHVAVVCFCVPADPSCSTFIQALGSAGGLLASENESVGVGMIDVDGTQEDVCGTFKIKAMPSTLFFRDARETARVEGCDFNELRKTVTAHLISFTMTSDGTGDGKIIKKNSDEENANGAEGRKEREEKDNDVKIVNCYFGNFDSGKLFDCTDKIRQLLKDSGYAKHFIIKADKSFLGCASTFDNTENNKLRIIVDKNGVGKTFTINEGKEFDLGVEMHFVFEKHQGRDVYDEKEARDANGDHDFTNAPNPYGGLPSLPEPQQTGCRSR